MFGGRKAISALNFTDHHAVDDRYEGTLTPNQLLNGSSSMMGTGVNPQKRHNRENFSNKGRTRFSSLHAERSPKYSKASLIDQDHEVFSNAKKWKSSVLLIEVKLKELVEKALESPAKYKNSALLNYCLSILQEFENTCQNSDEAYIYGTMRLVFEDCLFLNTLSEENLSLYTLKIPYYTLRTKEKEEE